MMSEPPYFKLTRWLAEQRKSLTLIADTSPSVRGIAFEVIPKPRANTEQAWNKLWK